jgi:hypothetical protein
MFGLSGDAAPHAPWEPPLDLNRKDQWGFHHPQIARLLVPLIEGTSDDEVDRDDSEEAK